MPSAEPACSCEVGRRDGTVRLPSTAKSARGSICCAARAADGSRRATLSEQFLTESLFMWSPQFLSTVAVLVAPPLLAATLDAQGPHRRRTPERPAHAEQSSCTIVCAPSVTLMPGVIRTHLARGPL